MKDFLTVIKLTLIGLFVAIIAYPLIHETGHILATAMTGGKLIALSWVPVPNVLCEVNSTNITALAITSLAGMVFPMVLVFMLMRSKGLFRYGVLIFSMVTILSAVIDTGVAFLHINGMVVQNDDIASFMEFTGWTVQALLLMAGLLCVSVTGFFLLKPANTIKAVLFNDKKLGYRTKHKSLKSKQTLSTNL